MQIDDGSIKIKAILVGDAGVGKTNLINITIGKKFNEDQKSTIISYFSEKKIEMNNEIYKLQIWDTMGQETLKSLTKIFFKNSKIVILVFDITRKKTFIGLEYWVKEIKDNLEEDIILGICGNKTDLIIDQQVDEEECEKYAKNINAKWTYTSAKMDKKGIIIFLKELLKDYIKLYNSKNPKDKNRKESIKKINLNNNNNKVEKKEDCC